MFQALLTMLVQPGGDGYVGSPKRYDTMSVPLQKMARKLNSAKNGRLVVIRQNEPEVIALVHAGLANNWDRLRDMATARTLVNTAEDLRRRDPALAAQLSLAAYRLSPIDSVRSNLLDTFASPYAIRLTRHTNFVETVAVHRNLLATGGQDRRIQVWDVGNRTGHATWTR